jgi:hypothetical protein
MACFVQRLALRFPEDIGNKIDMSVKGHRILNSI